MRVHSQSHVKATYNEKKDMLGETERRYHDATDVACPYCESPAGQPCKGLHALSVHMARQDASL